MDVRVDEILEQALALPDEDRLRLAEALLSSVEQTGAPPFDPEWIGEAKRRAARIDSGEVKLNSWKEVRGRSRR